MSYKLTKFNGTNLPAYNRVSVLNSAPAQNGIAGTVLGGYDTYGADVAPMATPYPLTLRAVVSEDTPAGQRASIDGMRALARVRGQLVRQAEDDDTEQWCYARLMSVDHDRDAKIEGYRVLLFNWIIESGWYKDKADQADVLDGSPFTLSVVNSGNRPVNNAILTISADDANLTAVTLTTTNGTHLIWSGTVTAGNDLVFDFGAKSITNNGANDYANLSYGGNHSIDDWLVITGSMDITIAYTGGGTAPPVTIAYDDRWA